MTILELLKEITELAAKFKAAKTCQFDKLVDLLEDFKVNDMVLVKYLRILYCLKLIKLDNKSIIWIGDDNFKEKIKVSWVDWVSTSKNPLVVEERNKLK